MEEWIELCGWLVRKEGKRRSGNRKFMVEGYKERKL